MEQLKKLDCLGVPWQRRYGGDARARGQAAAGPLALELEDARERVVGRLGNGPRERLDDEAVPAVERVVRAVELFLRALAPALCCALLLVRLECVAEEAGVLALLRAEEPRPECAGDGAGVPRGARWR